MWISNTAAVPILSPGYSWLFGGAAIGPIPVLLLWVAVLGGLGHIVMRRSGFGRRVLATGGGETAARYSGIDTANIKMKVLVLSSCAATLAGMLYAGCPAMGGKGTEDWFWRCGFPFEGCVPYPPGRMAASDRSLRRESTFGMSDLSPSRP